ncbi:ATP-binding protein [Candidatus Poriferisodalis sp.]|uniref:ATP-binding protein n=1 Tax=Candidatus Poriferisodalis sp. TaxID=3101277 RepID=UPI003B01233F
MPNQTAKREALIARHAEARVRSAMVDTRIVAIVGPRQSGKTTLARRIADNDDRQFITLDDEQSRRFAQDDPTGFTRGLKRAVIDETQRAPDLILALKRIVDEDPRPGRFLITGSVELFTGSLSPDSLAGRVETVELLPFSQAEIVGMQPPSFVDRAFAGDFAALEIAGRTDGLAERVVRGGFPEALSRSAPARHRSWLRNYARMIAEHDVREIARVSKRGALPRLIDHAAAAAGGLLNMSGFGTRLGVDGKTVDRWLVLLEHMFLIRRVHAWHRSDLKRLVKAPKLQFLDSGLLAALRGVDAAGIADDRRRLGPLLECFAYTELVKASALSSDMTTISHYRDKSGVEVDFVLERSPGVVVGIEVKSRATAHPRDFKGLRRLKDAVGDNFASGILLHDGDRIQQIAPDLYAMPVKMLWEF